MSLHRPIFIIGTGRCGSTIFHQIFAHHPRLAFLSGLCQMYPGKPHYNTWAMRMMDVPVLHKWARRKFRPAEHWDFWDHYVRGFSAPFRDLVAEDVRPNECKKIRRVLESMVTPKRDRLLIKLTGWPRTGFLTEIFPDALFIHVVRDGRAVANSLLNTDFWKGWGGPEQWQWGPLSEEEQAEWDRHGRSFVALAAIQWKILMRSFESAKKSLPGSQYMELKYERFATDPQGMFAQVLDFCGLDYPAEFKQAIGRFKVESANYKWQESLTPLQRDILDQCLHEALGQYGYHEREALAVSR